MKRGIKIPLWTGKFAISKSLIDLKPWSHSPLQKGTMVCPSFGSVRLCPWAWPGAVFCSLPESRLWHRAMATWAFLGTVAVLGRTLPDDRNQWLGTLGTQAWAWVSFARPAGPNKPFFFFFSFASVKITEPECKKTLWGLNKFPPTRKLCDSGILNLAGFQTWYSLGVGHKRMGTSI